MKIETSEQTILTSYALETIDEETDNEMEYRHLKNTPTKKFDNDG